MEGQEGLSAPVRTERVIRKSPQELAVQIQSVYGTFLKSTRHPEGEQLDERYKESRSSVERLLESGVSNEQLEEELGKLYEQGKELGIYTPLEGKKKMSLSLKRRSYYLLWGYPEAEAEAEARKILSKKGYLAELRNWRVITKRI